MLYLNEDAVKSQINRCKKTKDSSGIYCSKCNKKQKKLCPLGEAWHKQK
jgi:hypothetical protein